MRLEWEEAGQLFQRLEQPKVGFDWFTFFERVWESLSSNDMTKFATEAELVRVLMRVIAMNWLAHDYCIERGESTECVGCWAHQLGIFNIDPVWAYFSLGKCVDLHGCLSQSQLIKEKITIADRSSEAVRTKIDDELKHRLAFLAIYSERKTTVDSLIGLIGADVLLCKLIVGRFSLDEICEMRRQDLTAQVDSHRKSFKIVEHKDDDSQVYHLSNIARIEADLATDKVTAFAEKIIGSAASDQTADRIEWGSLMPKSNWYGFRFAPWNTEFSWD